ncbi:MAG: DUF3105 domain-containing protein [Chloroflexota bacterium]
MNQDEERARRRQGSLRAQAARTKRTQASSRRAQRRTLLGIAGILVVGAIAIAVALALSDGSGPDLGYAVEELPGRHAPPYQYVSELSIDGQTRLIPPSSGNHTDARSDYGFLGEPLVAENAVHNLEHGAVVIWYQPDDPVLAGQVNRLIADVSSECVLAGSYIYMDFPVAATVWGRVLPLETFDAAALTAFIVAYRGKVGPEAGVCQQES